MLIKREMAGNAIRIRLASYPENLPRERCHHALITTLPSSSSLHVHGATNGVDIWREGFVMDGSTIARRLFVDRNLIIALRSRIEKVVEDLMNFNQ